MDKSPVEASVSGTVCGGNSPSSTERVSGLIGITSSGRSDLHRNASVSTRPCIWSRARRGVSFDTSEKGHVNGLTQVCEYITYARVVWIRLRLIARKAAWVRPGLPFGLSWREVRNVDRLNRWGGAGQVRTGSYRKGHSQSSKVSFRAKFLIHRSGDKRLTSLFRRYLSLHSEPAAASCVRCDVALRSDYMAVQNLKTLKRAAYFFLNTAPQIYGHRLPQNFGRGADFIRVHLLLPILAGRQTRILDFCSMEDGMTGSRVHRIDI